MLNDKKNTFCKLYAFLNREDNFSATLPIIAPYVSLLS